LGNPTGAPRKNLLRPLLGTTTKEVFHPQEAREFRPRPPWKKKGKTLFPPKLDSWKGEIKIFGPIRNGKGSPVKNAPKGAFKKREYPNISPGKLEDPNDFPSYTQREIYHKDQEDVLMGKGKNWNNLPIPLRNGKEPGKEFLPT